ncbi:MAG: OPT/YSL family transporter [Eggerthellaceae bacterium]|nr:OPT/YSL family transporter [Eggerthellaceae bacterium]
MNELKGQLTLRGVIIGCVGCVIITAASMYTALKMGALPWPIIFVALVSYFFLRVLGSRSLNEANVTHTIMSAGSMVAGGLAFTIPGIFILGLGDVPLWQMLLVALAGSILGLIGCAVFRANFIEKQQLEFPIGQAAAETLKAGDAGGKVGAQLFGAMGFAGAWAALRDAVGVIPAMLFGGVAIPGITFGIYLSPMMLAVGFLVGAVAMVAWFGGALVQLLIVAGGSSAGLFDVATGQAINSSLGMGLMMGCGIAVVCKGILPKALRALKNRGSGEGVSGDELQAASANALAGKRNLSAGVLGLLGAVVSLLICFALGIGPLGSVIVVLLSFATVAMSAQSVGQTGIDPMEIFGLIVLLFVALVGDTPQVQLFFVAGVIAVACGIGGDVMNDFKAGHVLGTNPRAQLVGQAIGGVIGAVVAAGTLYALVSAYGPDAFGVGHDFVAAQASVVATLVGGIPNAPAFIIGLVVGFGIYLLGGPAMMIGLGVYLPFYMSFTAFLGCLAKWIYDAVAKARRKDLPEAEQRAAREKSNQAGLVVASGLLGGESIVGVCMALAAVFM